MADTASPHSKICGAYDWANTDNKVFVIPTPLQRQALLTRIRLVFYHRSVRRLTLHLLERGAPLADSLRAVCAVYVHTALQLAHTFTAVLALFFLTPSLYQILCRVSISEVLE